MAGCMCAAYPEAVAGERLLHDPPVHVVLSKSMSISPPPKNGPTSRVHAGLLANALSLLRSAASTASGPSSMTAWLWSAEGRDRPVVSYWCRIIATGSRAYSKTRPRIGSPRSSPLPPRHLDDGCGHAHTINEEGCPVNLL